jgi:flagellar biosynthesis protein FlhF
MQIKRYEVSSISEALTKIKADLGPEAIILSTKKIKGLKTSMLEVMAARDEKVDLPGMTFNKEEPLRNKNINEDQNNLLDLFRNEISELKEMVRSAQRENSLGRELEEIRETMDKFFDVLGVRKGKLEQDINQKIYYHLLAGGFSRSAACRILEAVKEKLSSHAQLTMNEALRIVENFVMKSIPVLPEGKTEKRIKTFVGATGVGKTTTLAKLAARYSLMKKKRVGLITTDTFRISATEQLQTYAKIMGVRMEVASTKEGLQKALHIFSDKDIILVDTPGRPNADNGYSSLLGNLLQNRDVETNLLISATSSEDNMKEIVNRYSPFGYENMIITKIDESRRFGILYDVIKKAGKPVTYLTCGQNVPQDIEEVTPSGIANLIMRSVVN